MTGEQVLVSGDRHEYRLTTIREDLDGNRGAPHHRIYQTREAAEKRALLVTGRIAEYTGLDPDAFACCDGAAGAFDGPCSCRGESNAEVWAKRQEVYDPVVELRLQSRPVGEWSDVADFGGVRDVG